MKNRFSQVKKYIVENIKYFETLDNYESPDFSDELLTGYVWAYEDLGLITKIQCRKLTKIIEKMSEYYIFWDKGRLFKNKNKKGELLSHDRRKNQ